MNENQHSRFADMNLPGVAAFAVAALVVCSFIYLIYEGHTDSWPAAKDCSVVDSRVVTSTDTHGNSKDGVTYRGEYRVRYVVNGKNYFTWTESEWQGTDEDYVKRNVNKLPTGCPVSIRYNPTNPDESVTYSKHH